MKKIQTIFSVLFTTLIIIGCTKDPEACFTSTIGDDGVVKFSSACSENAESFQWNFGDQWGTSGSSAANPTYDYWYPGTYTVVLTAKNGDKTDTSEETIILEEYCVICTYADGSDHKFCGNYFKSEAEEAAENSDDSFSGGCKAEKR